MKKFLVRQDANYIMGYLKYGHRTCVIEANSIEEARRMIEEDDYTDLFDIVIDSYRIEDADFGDNEFKITEIE